MKFVSPIGIFSMELNSVEVKGDRLLFLGKMGEWGMRVRIYYDYADIVTAIKLLLKPKVILYILSSPFKIWFRKK